MTPRPDAEDETELRAFARQREGDLADAPAWHDEWLRAPLAGRSGVTPLHRALLTVASVCFVLAGVISMPAFKALPPLTQALPPLFEKAQDAPPAELFADLRPSSSSFMSAASPSDFLLPDHLASSSNSSLLFPRP